MTIKRVGLFIALSLLVVLIFLNRTDIEFLKQTDFTYKRISNSGGEISSVLHLKNPNLLSSTIKRVNERFYIDGRLIGELDNELTQGIPGRKTTNFPVSVRVPAENIQPEEDTAVVLTVRGEITFENLFGGGTVIINQKDSLLVSN